MWSIIFGTLSVCLLGVSPVAGSSDGKVHFPFQSLLGKSFLSSHEMTEDSFHHLLLGETAIAAASPLHASEAHHYITCGPLAELRGKRAELLAAAGGLTTDHVRTLYQSRVRDMGCMLVLSRREAMESASIHAAHRSVEGGRWTYVSVPAFLKLRNTVLDHFKAPSSRMESSSKKDDVLGLASPQLPSNQLQVELSLGAVKDQSVKLRAARMATSLQSMDLTVADAIARTNGWKNVLSSIESSLELTCSIPHDTVKAHGSYVIIASIDKLSDACLAKTVEILSANPAVLSLHIGPTPRIVNYDGRDVDQTGTTDAEPYTKAGLTGWNQIATVMDTGLDDLSCFFADDSCSTSYGNCLTPRDGEVYPDRSKVIQYIPYADSTDYEGGHGSHVTGSVLGSARSVTSASTEQFTNVLKNFNGIAMDSKVAFQDIGDSNGNLGALDDVSLYMDAFPAAYAAGSRVHTNSWGGYPSYDSYAGDVDRYTYENPDFLVLVAAGNDGNVYGRPSVGTPGSAKNALTVGSGQVRDNSNDEDFAESTMSSFSSCGPTEEGRIKPDIVSPGSYISSARAADPEFYYYASTYSIFDFSCTTIQMSGTSMATPLTAGTALLVRQYFSNSSFWEEMCDTSYSTCASGAFEPSGYLVKATIMHSGEPISRYGAPVDMLPVILGATPDVYQGYGYVTLSNVLPLAGLDQDFSLYVHDAAELAEGQTMEWQVTVPADSAPLKATIVWYDVYAEMNGHLIHNLDLKITDPTGKVYLGNNNAFGGDDVNPNEQVTISSTACDLTNCVYTVTVTGISISMAATQTFALVMTTTGAVAEPTTYVTPAVASFDSLKLGKTTSFDQGTRQSMSISEIAARAQPFLSHRAAPAKKSIKKNRSLRASAAAAESEASELVVDIGSVTLDSGNSYSFSKNFNVASDQDLSTVLFQITNWELSTYCPVYLMMTITDPNENSFIVGEWPWNFGSCFFDDQFPFTLSYYSHLAGMSTSGLGGAGVWSVKIAWVLFQGDINFDLSMTLTTHTPNTEYMMTTTSLDISVAPDNEVSYQFEVSIPEWDSNCYQLSHVKTTMDFVSNNGCSNPSTLSLLLSDASSRSVGLLSLLRLSWYSDAGGEFTADDLVESAALTNGGIYTMSASIGDQCTFSNTVDFELYFFQTECPAATKNDVVEIPFDVSLTTCLVLVPAWIGDGWCDYDTIPGNYNSAGCNYDGGDCCVESCVSSASECGENGYQCVDPEYAGYSYEYSYSDAYSTEYSEMTSFEYSESDDASMVYSESDDASMVYSESDDASMVYSSEYSESDDASMVYSESDDASMVYSSVYSAADDASMVYSSVYSAADDASMVYSSVYSAAGDASMVYSSVYSESGEFSAGSSSIYSSDFVASAVYSGDFSGPVVPSARKLLEINSDFSVDYSVSDSVDYSVSDSMDYSVSDSMDYSFTYSMQDDYSFLTSAVAILDEFEQDGNLVSVTLNLDPSGLPDQYLAWLVAVLVVDPFDRVLQVGGYEKAFLGFNSVVMDWPENWLTAASFSVNGTRDVAAAGLSSTPPVESEMQTRRLTGLSGDIPFRQLGRRADFQQVKTTQRVEASAADKVMQWRVYLIFAYDDLYLPEINYKGLVRLEFENNSTSTTATPTKSPTVAPTKSPTVAPTKKPTRAPTVAPTLAPTKTNIGTYISFNSSIQIDSVACSDYELDQMAQEASRLSTLESLNDNMEDDEVKDGRVSECLTTRRGLLGARISGVTVRRSLVDGVVVDFLTVANINNLGFTDPGAAYSSLTTSLALAISSGNYTSLLKANSALLNSTTLADASVTQEPAFTEFTVTEITAPSGGGGGGNDDDNVGAIVGGVIGGIVGLAIIVGIIYYFFFHKANGAEAIYNQKAVKSSSASDINKPKSAVGASLSEDNTNTSFDNPIFTRADTAPSGKAADSYGGL